MTEWPHRCVFRVNYVVSPMLINKDQLLTEILLVEFTHLLERTPTQNVWSNAAKGKLSQQDSTHRSFLLFIALLFFFFFFWVWRWNHLILPGSITVPKYVQQCANCEDDPLAIFIPWLSISDCSTGQLWGDLHDSDTGSCAPVPYRWFILHSPVVKA